MLQDSCCSIPTKLLPEDEAERHAVEMGFPVVMKISSPDIMHKTDIGGVRVGIESPRGGGGEEHLGL